MIMEENITQYIVKNNSVLEINNSNISAKALSMSEKAKDDLNSDEIPIKKAKLDISQNVEEKPTTTTPQALRLFKKIPIFIVEQHNDVLEFIFRCFGSRHLPLHNNTVIHFDSHPDMVIPRELTASTIYEKSKQILNELSIENWLMPACYVGHFSKIIWIKNSWCSQILPGSYDFTIGAFNDEIQVDLPIDYFLSEGNYCPKDCLSNKRKIHLDVLELDKSIEKSEITYDNLVENESYILDIDLDYFSTANPFLEIYKKSDCYEKLTEIFKWEKSKDATNNETDNFEKISEDRKYQLGYLGEIFDHLETERNLDDFGWDPENDQKDNILNLVESLKKEYADIEIDWQLIYNAGCTSDSDGLPHHISSDDELKVYYYNFEKFLRKLKYPPTVVTISRSSEDDYTPKIKCDDIQDNVLKILKLVFNEKIMSIPICYYNEDEWNINDL